MQGLAKMNVCPNISLFSKEVTMTLFKLFIVCGVVAIGALSVEAADMEMKIVDKNCWIEIFEDDNYDADDPHVKIQGPKEIATLKNLEGKDWANDIESIIVGSTASVHAFEDRDFKGTEITFAPDQRVPNLGKLDMANDIESLKISCQK
jgi:hypothetical protein